MKQSRAYENTKTIMFIGLLSLISSVNAADIYIPNGSFEGLSATINPPVILGTTSGNIGAWTADIKSFLDLGGDIQVGTAAAVGGPTPPDGTNELDINLPASILASASLSQTLTNKYLPDSTYVLSVALDQGTIANLISGATLSLNAGSTSLASLSGATLASILNNGSGFQTVTLTNKTGNTVPTNCINISLSDTGLTSIGGNVYVDNFKLTVNPTQIQLNSAANPSTGNLTFSGSGGAPNATYEIITSTNLFAFTTNWATINTNHFDANGNFSVNIKPDANIPYRFFRLFMP
jgi:hypothetical protein